MRCDFCSAFDPTWEYPARTFIAYRVAGFTGESVGSWAACDPCHVLIEANDRDGLVERSLGRLGVMDEGVRESTGACLRALHAKFFANRLGPPTQHASEGRMRHAEEADAG